MIEKVDVYWDIRNCRYSFKSRQSGLVVKKTRNGMLFDVSFIVQPAGLDKVRETGVKNVHSFLRAEYAIPTKDKPHVYGWENSHFITYNPKKEGQWVYYHDRERAVPERARAIRLMTKEKDGKIIPVVEALFD